MYRLQVERVIRAEHAIVIGGEREAMHGHDWRIRLRVEGPRLDAEGLLCDFHALEQQLDGVLAPFHNVVLNETPPFDEINPTAERLAEHIAMQIAASPPEAVIQVSVAVTEASGCEATCMIACTRTEALP
jgi:6-pyruvoyltetrahydropterin/6-carboxytetrahydropterin synthase